MTTSTRQEIMKVQSAIRSFRQQLSFNPSSECNKVALAQAEANLAGLQAAKAA